MLVNTLKYVENDMLNQPVHVTATLFNESLGNHQLRYRMYWIQNVLEQAIQHIAVNIAGTQ